MAEDNTKNVTWVMNKVYYLIASFKYLKVVFFPMLFMVLDMFLRFVLVNDYTFLTSLLVLLSIFFGMASAINYKSIINSDNQIEFRVGAQLTILSLWVVVKILFLYVEIHYFVDIILGVLVFIAFIMIIKTLCKHNRTLIDKDYLSLIDTWVITNKNYGKKDPVSGADLEGGK